jgi:hypothetical protein
MLHWKQKSQIMYYIVIITHIFSGRNNYVTARANLYIPSKP